MEGKWQRIENMVVAFLVFLFLSGCVGGCVYLLAIGKVG